MKLKVLSVGRHLEHDLIEQASFEGAKVFTDYDVLIVDPDAVRDLWADVTPRDDGTLFTDLVMYKGIGRRVQAMIERRTEECIALLRSGGLIVLYLRPLGHVLNIRKTLSGEPYQDFHYSIYTWLARLGQTIESEIQQGSGSIMTLSNAKHPFSQLFQAYSNTPSFGFLAYLREKPSFQVIAVNKVGQPVAFEASFEGGRVMFLPAFDSQDTRKESGILVNCIRSTLSVPGTSEPPVWLANYTVPGQGRNADEIAQLDEQIRKLQGKKELLEQQENGLAQFQWLLYEQGKFQLEPVVRRGFRALGFQVPEPDEYEEDWDVFLRSPEREGVAEVVGRDDNAIDIDKFRQLLHYQTDWLGKDLDYKGILVVNGYRLTDPRERGVQITGSAKRNCEKQGFCVLSTTELFKAVRAVLEQPENEELKRQIRLSLLEKTGLYNFDEALASAWSSISKNGVIA